MCTRTADRWTEFSGITHSTLAAVSTALSDVQDKLLQILPCDAVLVGHSLDADLRALHMIHPHVIDTSLLYRQDFGRRFKLKILAQVILNRQIQSEDRRGHDPCEDALAALHLAQHFIRKGPREVLEDHLDDLWDVPEIDDSDHQISSDQRFSSLRFGHALYGSGQSAVFLGGAVETNGSVANQCRRQQCSSDREVVCVFRRLVQLYSLSVLRFSSFSNTLNHMTATGRQQHLQQVHAEVVFEHLEGAQLALDLLNGHQINGCTIKRDAAAYERDAAAYERDPVAYDRDDVAYERDAAAYERDPVAYERDAVAYERDAAAYERDPVAYERDAVAYERDAAA
ncbi:hypothetical protein PO909_016502 [Leuciscus waleckii]